MSNVYTRNRKKTPFDVLANAEKLQDLVTLYVMNERYVPKKWRFMIGQDLIKKIDELNDNNNGNSNNWNASNELYVPV